MHATSIPHVNRVMDSQQRGHLTKTRSSKMNAENPFKKAERRQAWLKLAFTGPSGSGKTFSALTVASGMATKIAVIDTENHSASLYADRFNFDALEIDPPYTIKKYNDAIRAAVTAGYEVLIIDSITHAWAGEGGLLQQKEDLDARGGKNANKFTNWGAMTKEHERFKAALLSADIHLIVTMRSKQDYVLGEGNKPVKVGMAPVQREGMEYEFTTVLDLAVNHTAQTSKDRTNLFDNSIFTPTKDTGATLMKWLMEGTKPEPRKPEVLEKVLDLAPNTGQLKRLFALAQEFRWPPAEVKTYIWRNFKKESSQALTMLEYNRLCSVIMENPHLGGASDINAGEIAAAEAVDRLTEAPNAEVPQVHH